jgi:formylglycine-generating enzyme required for sulfatase activity
MDMKRILMIFSMLGLMISSCQTDEGLDGGFPTVETLPVKIATSSTAVLRGSTTGGTLNMLCRGVCFSTSDVFTFKDSPCVSTDAGEGEFAIRTYELKPMTEYNMKAFAVMKDGTIVYGQEMKFSTTDFQLPTVQMDEVTDIYSTEATLNGTLVEAGDYGVTGRGFVYTADASAVLEIGSEGVMSVLGKVDGESFSATVTGLEIGQIYRVRAYAMTENGAGYSDESSFTTLDIKPMEFGEIVEVENTYSSLKISTSVTNYQDAVATSFGFCWSSTNPLPTVKNDQSKTLTDAFEMSFKNVKPGQVYYVRAWTEADVIGISYSAVKKVRVKTYDCEGGMVKIVPAAEVWIGWLGDKDSPDMAAKFSMADDGEFIANMSVNKNSVPTPSKAVNMKPFCIAKYEVTNKWFCEFLNAYGSRIVKDGKWQGKDMLFDGYTDIVESDGKWTVDEQYLDCPVVGVTWYGALAFCEYFGGYLPNEAQWEIAARGNVYSNDESVPMYTYSGSSTITDVAVCSVNGSVTHVQPVGTKMPNQLGIYDMSGNAQEMTSSWYANYAATYRDVASNNNNQITVRGGRAQRGVLNTFQCCSRDALTVTAAQSYSNYVGFRFACNPTDE